MGCATGMVKYLVFLANLVFALAGLALVVIGVMYKFQYNDAIKTLPGDFGIAPILSIIVGSIVFITAFLGCCGAVKESTCMLTTYAIILLTIFIVQVAIGVYAFLKIKDSGEFRQSIEVNLRKTFDNYGKNQEATEAVDVMQRFLHCCGLNGPKFFNLTFPLTCCDTENDHCNILSPTLHHDGCLDNLESLLYTGSQIIGGVVIGIAAIEIIGACFGFCLANSIRNYHRRYMQA